MQQTEPPLKFWAAVFAMSGSNTKYQRQFRAGLPDAAALTGFCPLCKAASKAALVLAFSLDDQCWVACSRHCRSSCS